MAAMIRSLFSGRYPLWCVFWLVGFPIFVIHYVAAGCGLGNHDCGIGDVKLMWIILISGIATLAMAIPIWRSATNYQRPRFLSVLAKVYVVLALLIAVPMSAAVLFPLVVHAVTGRA